MRGIFENISFTRGFPGNSAILTTREIENPDHIRFVEIWDSAEDFSKYIEKQTERGVIEELLALTAAEPVFEFYEFIGV
ncbi:MAG: hypothetical protein QM809_06270 [Gordonia sp. (in: high G+C Gram-positive bacteria)]|uniref:putative quinol monooxygenase n=1 Tax=Gordonia sp. (in: high G+C Gram-positive bacteria) TaxID=84139 RepID=UPI0039E5FA91